MRGVAEGTTGHCSSRVHSYRATSETKEYTRWPQHKLVSTSSDEMVTGDLRFDRAAVRQYSTIWLDSLFDGESLPHGPGQRAVVDRTPSAWSKKVWSEDQAGDRVARDEEEREP